MHTDAVRRDLGAILAHGEPETGMGQGEAAESAETTTPDATVEPRAIAPDPAPAGPAASGQTGELVAVDFTQLGPNGSPAA